MRELQAYLRRQARKAKVNQLVQDHGLSLDLAKKIVKAPHVKWKYQFVRFVKDLLRLNIPTETRSSLSKQRTNDSYDNLAGEAVGRILFDPEEEYSPYLKDKSPITTLPQKKPPLLEDLAKSWTLAPWSSP